MICVTQLCQAIDERISTYLSQENPIALRKTIELDLLDSLGAILAQDIFASLDIPRQNLSAMDGFALAKHSNLNQNTQLTIVGESCAGKPFMGRLDTNQGVRIFTGAVVPDDCNTVVMQEHTDFDTIKSNLDKTQPYHITLNKSASTGSHIRKQGEEICQNELILPKGKRINPSDISLLASMGLNKITIIKPLTVGLLATGDELVTVGKSLTNLAQIYNSNTPTLQALLAKLPINIINYGIVPDNLSKTLSTIQAAINACDVIISTAGVSVGDYDFLTEAVNQLGKINHYKVAMKPGKPFVFGEFYRFDNPNDNQTGNYPVLYFGLPGNPLSTVVGCINFVRPALWQMAGTNSQDIPKPLQLTATTTQAISKSVGRKEYQRGFFVQENQNLLVTPATAQDSHRIKQLSCANCFIVLDEDSTGVSSGDDVMIEPFDWVFG